MVRAGATRVRRWLAVAVAAAIIAVPASQDVVDAGAAGPATGATYVALGDSYASGEGLGPYEAGTDERPRLKGSDNVRLTKNTCHRSTTDAYGSVERSTFTVLPEVPAAERAFWACSGARAADVDRAQGSYRVGSDFYQYGEPAQTDALSPTTRWISLSAGGNDIQFANIIRVCGSYAVGKRSYRFPKPGKRPAGSVNADKPATCPKAVAYAAKRLTKKGTGPGGLRPVLTGLYRRILAEQAPNARLSVVGYPRVLPTTFAKAPKKISPRLCATNSAVIPTGVLKPTAPAVRVRLGFRVADARAINRDVVNPLASTIKAAVRDLADDPQFAGRITYVDTAAVSTPHDCSGKTTKATVNGFVISPGLNGDPAMLKGLVSTATLHPSRRGQATMGKAVARSFERNDDRNRLGWTASAAGMGPLVLGTQADWPERDGLVEPVPYDTDGCVQSPWQDTDQLVDLTANPDSGAVHSVFGFDDRLRFLWLGDPDFPTTMGIHAGSTVSAVQKAYPKVASERVPYEGVPASVLSEKALVLRQGDHFMVFTLDVNNTKRTDAILIGQGTPRFPEPC